MSVCMEGRSWLTCSVRHLPEMQFITYPRTLSRQQPLGLKVTSVEGGGGVTERQVKTDLMQISISFQACHLI